MMKQMIVVLGCTLCALGTWTDTVQAKGPKVCLDKTDAQVSELLEDVRFQEKIVLAAFFQPVGTDVPTPDEVRRAWVKLMSFVSLLQQYRCESPWLQAVYDAKLSPAHRIGPRTFPGLWIRTRLTGVLDPRLRFKVPTGTTAR